MNTENLLPYFYQMRYKERDDKQACFEVHARIANTRVQGMSTRYHAKQNDHTFTWSRTQKHRPVQFCIEEHAIAGFSILTLSESMCSSGPVVSRLVEISEKALTQRLCHLDFEYPSINFPNHYQRGSGPYLLWLPASPITTALTERPSD